MDNEKLIQCQYRRKCSGCQLLNLTYSEQLLHKQNMVQKLLGEYCDIQPIIGMENPFNYRNKVQAAFCTEYKTKKLTSGVYQSSTGRVCPVDSCMIEDKVADEIILTIRKLLVSFKLKLYDEETKKGFIRSVLVRRGFATGDIMVVIVSGTKEFKKKTSFVNALLKHHPQITTIVHNVNDSDTKLMLGEYSEVLYGDGYIEDKLCGCTFRISPHSFYQINAVQTEILYSKAIEYADLTGDEIVFDSYCGTGTIGIIASKIAKKVIGVELNSDAVNDAVSNAKLNNVSNIEFYCDDAGKFLVEKAKQNEKIDVLIMDPPRKGSDRKFLNSVLKIEPQKVVYVSCNLETLARDLKQLSKKYTVSKVQSVDMFPFTNHVETVVLLCHI